jgi:hypothetical protein
VGAVRRVRPSQRSLGDALARTAAQQVARFRRGGRPAIAWAVRLSAAAVAGYLVALVLFPGTQPLLAPLTALLVVQVTPVSLLASGVDRVVSVVAGVSLAVAFSAVVPLQWWSLGVLIATSIMIGQVLRLQSNLIEVPISAMLVLGVGSLGADRAAWQRITETLVGAAVGIAANLLLPPKVATADAGEAIDELAERLSGLLARAADELAELGPRRLDVVALAGDWLDEARAITHDLPTVGATLLRAEQGRRLNVRAVGRPDAGPGLRQGLEAVEHSAVAVRSMFRAVLDATSDESWPDDDLGEEVLEGLEQVLRELAAGVEAFGDLVRAEAQPQHRDVAPHAERVRAALAGLHEARSRLEDLMTTSSTPVVSELHASVLATVKRLMAETDLDSRLRRQLRLARHPHRPPPRPPHPPPPGPPPRPTDREGRPAPPEPTVPPEEEPTQPFRLP